MRVDYLKVLKEPIRRLVKRVGGGREASKILNKGESTISGYLNQDKSFSMPLADILKLEEVAGENIVTGILSLIKQDNNKQDQKWKPMAELLKNASILNNSASMILEAIEDGKITPAEISKIIALNNQVLSHSSKMTTELEFFKNLAMALPRTKFMQFKEINRELT